MSQEKVALTELEMELLRIFIARHILEDRKVILYLARMIEKLSS